MKTRYRVYRMRSRLRGASGCARKLASFPTAAGYDATGLLPPWRDTTRQASRRDEQAATDRSGISGAKITAALVEKPANHIICSVISKNILRSMQGQPKSSVSFRSCSGIFPEANGLRRLAKSGVASYISAISSRYLIGVAGCGRWDLLEEGAVLREVSRRGNPYKSVILQKAPCHPAAFQCFETKHKIFKTL